jgi:Histidine kinase
VTAARVIDTVRAAGVVVVTITVSLARPGPATAGSRGTAIAVLLGLSAAAWITWILTDGRDRLNAASLIAMGAAGGVLTGLCPNSPAVAVGCVAVFSAGARLSTVASLGITAETLAGFLATGLVAGIPTAELLGYAWAFVGLWTIALTRNEFLVRAVSAERTLVQTRRAREAETQAAALAERARIARDLHDVLAHSLAAVSVNLQAAEGLLSSGTLPQDNPEKLGLVARGLEQGPDRREARIKAPRACGRMESCSRGIFRSMGPSIWVRGRRPRSAGSRRPSLPGLPRRPTARSSRSPSRPLILTSSNGPGRRR